MKTLTLPTLTPDNALHNVVVFYHANCLDGLGALHAFNNSFYKLDLKHLIKGTIRYEPYTYNSTDLLKELSNHSTVSLVIFLDVALSNDIISLANSNLPLQKILLIDHHKSTETLMNHIIENSLTTRVPIDVTYDENLSGATLTAKYLDCRNGKHIFLYNLIQDWDLWKFKLDFSRELRASIGAKVFKFLNANDTEGALATLSDIAESFNHSGSKEILIEEGRFILRAKELKLAELVNMSAYIISSTTAIAFIRLPEDLENPSSYISELGNNLALYAMHMSRYTSCEYAIGMVVQDTKVSLRCAETNDIDLSVLATVLGGGGHKRAAGFTISKDTNLASLVHKITSIIDERSLV